MANREIVVKVTGSPAKVEVSQYSLNDRLESYYDFFYVDGEPRCRWPQDKIITLLRKLRVAETGEKCWTTAGDFRPKRFRLRQHEDRVARFILKRRDIPELRAWLAARALQEIIDWENGMHP